MPYWIKDKGWPVFPYPVERVLYERGGDRCKGIDHSRIVGIRKQVLIHDNDIVLGKVVFKPLRKRRRTRHILPHQLYPCPVQLCSSLYKKARIRPQCRPVHRDNQRPGLSGKTAQPFYTFVMVRYIFPEMRVGRWHNHRRGVFLSKYLSESAYCIRIVKSHIVYISFL